MKYFSALLSIFKNEGQVLDEWINFYLDQGIDHFYMIDNGSNDNSMDKLKPWIEKKRVTVFQDSGRWQQRFLYNKYFLKMIKNETIWCGVVDLDEFAYSTKYGSLRESLMSGTYDNFNSIVCPWKQFGSNNHVEQPGSLIEGFTQRQEFVVVPIHFKSFFKTEKLIKLGVHLSFFDQKFLDYITEYKKLNLPPWQSSFKLPDEYYDVREEYRRSKNEDVFDIVVNHYQTQSLVYYQKVKMTRGDVGIPANEKNRDMGLFNNFQKKCTIEDVKLLNIVKKRRACSCQ